MLIGGCNPLVESFRCTNPETPEPSFPEIGLTNLLFHFSADQESYSDDALTPTVDGDPVARWGNLGTSHDAIQPTSARRPIFHTGGLNDKPYVQCVSSLQQYFEDLAFTQPIGTTSFRPFTLFIMTDAVPVNVHPIIGCPSGQQKGATYFRTGANAQINFFHSDSRYGNIINPQLLMLAAGRRAVYDVIPNFSFRWMRQNKNLISPANFTGGFVTGAATTSFQFLRHSGFTPTVYYYEGRLYEFLLYEGILNDEVTFAVEDYLYEKYLEPPV